MTQRSPSRLLNLWSSSRSLATTVFSPMDKPWEQSRMKTDQSKNLVNYFSLSVCNGQCASVQVSGTYNGQLQNATLYTCDPSSVCAALQMTNNCSSPEPGLTGCCCDTVSIGLQGKLANLKFRTPASILTLKEAQAILCTASLDSTLLTTTTSLALPSNVTECAHRWPHSIMAHSLSRTTAHLSLSARHWS